MGGASARAGNLEAPWHGQIRATKLTSTGQLALNEQRTKPASWEQDGCWGGARRASCTSRGEPRPRLAV